MLAILAASAVLSRGGTARAAETTSVSLSMVDCDAARVPTDRLVELVRTEVAPADLTVPETRSAAGPGRPSEVRGSIELCHGSPERVRVTVSAGAETSLERVVDLSDVNGELRIRTLAVAFAEMHVRIRALTEREATGGSSSEVLGARGRAQAVAKNPPRPTPGEGQARNGTSRSSRQATESSWRLGSGLSVRSYTEPQTSFVGPWLSLELGSFQTEVLFLIASEDVATGTAKLYDAAGALGFSPLSSGTLVRIALGFRGELGMTWAIGSPRENSGASGATQRRARAAMLAEPRMALALSSAISVEARISAGIAHGVTATADRKPVATSGGLFVGTALGLSVGF